MKKPDIERKATSIDRALRTYIDKEVRPYLQTLLDDAQSRMHRHALKFGQGMGIYCFYLDDEPWGDELEYVPYRSQKTERYRAAFPMLVEFMLIVHEVEEHLNADVGNMNPALDTLQASP